jgi:hypothetical protein
MNTCLSPHRGRMSVYLSVPGLDNSDSLRFCHRGCYTKPQSLLITFCLTEGLSFIVLCWYRISCFLKLIFEFIVWSAKGECLNPRLTSGRIGTSSLPVCSLKLRLDIGLVFHFPAVLLPPIWGHILTFFRWRYDMSAFGDEFCDGRFQKLPCSGKLNALDQGLGDEAEQFEGSRPNRSRCIRNERFGFKRGTSMLTGAISVSETGPVPPPERYVLPPIVRFDSACFG